MSKELSQALVTTNVPFVANGDSLAFVAPIDRVDQHCPALQRSPTGWTVRPCRIRRDLINLATYYPHSNWDFYQFASIPDWPQTRDTANDTVLAEEDIVSLKFQFVNMRASCCNGAGDARFDYWNYCSGLE